MSRSNPSKLFTLPRVLTLVASLAAFPATAAQVSYDFNNNALPPGTSVNGTATVTGGALHLTEAGVNSAFGSFVVPDISSGRSVGNLTATWKSRIGAGGGGGADGYSFNWAPDSATTGFTAEEGTGTGLSVTVDTFDNGGGETGIEIKWKGAQVAFQMIPKDNPGNGIFLRKDTFVDARLTVDNNSCRATFTFDGQTISAELPGYVGQTGANFVIAARTGGANDNHYLDDLNITTGLRELVRENLIAAAGHQWAYNDATVTPGLAAGWELPAYDTNSAPGWKTGASLFGNDGAGIYDAAGQPFVGQGINGFLTPLDRLIGGAAARVTFYFRTKFNWSGPTAGVVMTASNWVDDGNVIFLNGVEVARLRLPAGPLTWDTLGSNPGTEGLVELQTFDASALVQGENTVAVELHQSSAGSSDVAFALNVAAVQPLAPTILDCTQPRSIIVPATRNTNLNCIAIGSPAPTFQWYLNGAAIDPGVNPSATAPTYQIVNMQASDAGQYYCVIANAVGSATSRVAQVDYLFDNTPPVILAASGGPTFDRVSLAFDGLLDATSANDSFNYSIVDGGGNTLNVISAARTTDGASVVLTTDVQAPDTVYMVTVTSVADFSGNVIQPPNNTKTFRSWSASACAGLIFEAYNTGGGNAVVNLTSHPSFPNSPDFRTVINTFDIRVATDPANPTFYNTDARENYGGRLRGFFVAPETGPHVFYFASDDNGELWMSSDERPSQKVRIARETAWSASKDWTTSGGASDLNQKRSAPINLQAGRAYYIEALYKEGGGGDNCAVAVQLPSQTTPPANGADAITGTYLGGVVPSGILGNITISQPPADQTVLANSSVTFTVGLNVPTIEDFPLPVCYQWTRDGMDIPGATGASYSISPVSLSDDGARFGVRAAIMGSSATSTEALLRVTQDTNGPICVSATAQFSLSNVVVRFSEFVDPTSSADGFNYSIAGFTVNGAVRNPDGMSVTLALDARLTPDSSYAVTIQNVTDLAGNTIDPNPCTLNFRTPVISCGFSLQELYFGIGGVAIADLTGNPKYPNSPDQSRYKGLLEANTADEFDNYGTRMSGWIIPPTSGNYNFFMSSDDAGDFWLSSDSNPSNVQLLCFEPVWNGRRDWTGTARRNAAAPENRSTTLFPGGIPLVAGQMYYYEARMKEGGGGDNLAVAWQAPGDPIPLNGSTPIPGAFLAALANPAGASINIVQQPANATFVIASDTLLSQDFTSNDGGFTVQTPRPFDGPWIYDNALGIWRADGQAPENNQANTSFLTSPALTVTKAGQIRVTFTHSHNFEFDGTRWDGGQLRVSVNGGAFTGVTAFSQNGYGGNTVAGNSRSELAGQPSFTAASAGAITSIAVAGPFNPGDTVQVQFMFAADSNTSPGDPDWGIDRVQVDQGVAGPQNVNFSVAADLMAGGSANPPTFYQWYRDCGAGFVPIAGANGATYSAVPTLADNGCRYRVAIYVPGATATSAEAVLTVVQPNTPPNFTCGPNVGTPEDSGPVSRANWATDIVPHSIPRTAVVYANDFSSGLAGMQVAGIATVADGVLKLTTPINSSYGAASIAAPVQTFESIEVAWKSRVGGGGGGGADGYSLNIGADVPADPGYGGEEGIGTGLIVTVDTFDNGTGQDVGVDIKWGGTRVAYIPMPKDDDGSGNFVRKDAFVNASLTLSPAGVATVVYDGNTASVTIPNYAGLTANRALFWARTGGANDNHWVDDFSLRAFPYDASSAESGQTVKFLVSNDHPEYFSVQPAVSENGTLSYTPAPNACGPVTVTVIAMDDGGTAFGGRDMSAPCTFTINIGCVCDPPVAVADMTNTVASTPITVHVRLNDTDADGDELTIAAVTQGANGTVAIAGGSVVYTPAPGFCGVDRFTYTITDGQCGQSTAEVVVTVTGCNRCPTASNGSLTVDQDATGGGQLVGNDPDGNPLQYIVAALPLHGALTVNPQTGAYSYTPAQGYCGPDSFKFVVDDSICRSAEATVTIDVKCRNQCPTARITVAPDCVVANIQPPLIISLDGSNACLVLDGSLSMDADGDPLTFWWYLDDSPMPFATGPVVTNCFPVGEHKVTLVVDDGKCTTGGGMDMVRFEVDTGCVAVEALIDEVNNSTLSRKEKRPLIAALKKACSEFERAVGKKKKKADDKHVEHAIKKLEEFQKKLKKIERDDPALAARWRAQAQAIIDASECALALDEILDPDSTTKPPTHTNTRP